MRARLLAIVLSLVPVGPARAQAGDPYLQSQASFNPQLFHPAPGPEAYLTVDGAQPLHHLSVGAGLVFDYARDPLSILTFSARTGDPYGAKVFVQSHVTSATAWIGLGLFERAQIALALPMTLYQTGDNYDGDVPAPDGVHVRSYDGFALGDPRLYLKVKLFGRARGFQLALSHWLSVPVGDDARLGGEKHFSGFAGEPRVIAEWLGGVWKLALDVGFAWRVDTSSFWTVGAGQALTYALGVAFDIRRTPLTLVGEVYGHHDFATGDYTAQSPLELDVDLRVRLGKGFSLVAGIGTGLVEGAGTPWPRAILGAGYEMQLHDRDGDGIPDSLDHCPDDAEDKDGFQDADGCPERDNDGDTILDADDKCPNEPEDFDQFHDEDGCPDPDNDNDGIPDIKDACPNDAEDHKPPKPNDGCPLSKSDSDNDGIPDAVDKCPLEPEDKDGFQDEDGCPDPDNDNDGVPDGFDDCPNTPEDMDGVDDEDGCPDAGVSGVRIKDGKSPLIETKTPIVAEAGRLTVAETKALDGVAQLLAKKPSVRVEIDANWLESAGDELGTAESQVKAEAVRRYLVKHGVKAERLVPSGHAVQEDPKVELVIVGK
jgi:hypothetical protein